MEQQQPTGKTLSVLASQFSFNNELKQNCGLLSYLLGSFSALDRADGKAESGSTGDVWDVHIICKPLIPPVERFHAIRKKPIYKNMKISGVALHLKLHPQKGA